MKTVFVAMSADIFHTGHLNIIQVARELGDVVVGLGTDEVNAQYKQMALMSYDQRKAILENIKGVTRVIPQPSLDLVPNIRALKPDYVVHGDDWKTGFLSETRQGVIDVLKEWDGQLIEPPYTSGISSTNLRAAINTVANTPEMRSRQLHRLLTLKPFVRMMAVQNGLTAAIVENAHAETGAAEFDVLWLGAESEAFVRGLIHPEFNDLSARLQTIQDILHCTRKPLVVDLGSPPSPEQFAHNVAQLERLGVSGVAISVSAEANNLARTIRKGKKAVAGHHFAIIAAIGPLALENQITKLLQLADNVIQSGADALLLSSAPESKLMLIQFLNRYKKLSKRIPILINPADCPQDEAELIQMGVQAVVYPNQLFCAAFKAMTQTAVAILQQPPETATHHDSSLNEIYTLLGKK